MAFNILVLLVILKLALTMPDSQVNNTIKDETDDDDEHGSTVIPTDDDDEQDFIFIPPFEMTNPSQVAAGKLYEGDMLLTDEQLDTRRNRKAKSYYKYRWPEGSDGYPLVPYIFLDSVNQDDVRAGLNHWMEHTCIKYEETNNTNQPHLIFHIGEGCHTNIGMQYYINGQKVSIGQNCNSLAIVVHEVGHAIGFYHEQSRSDRDDFVTVFLDNVKDGKEHNFDKSDDNNYSVPYDYASNMHYEFNAFSKNNKPTLITKDLLSLELLGSRNGLTHRDKLLANIMYNCTGKWLSKCGISSDPCLNDGYTGINCTCICPPGTNGSKCEEIVDDYYAQLRSPLSEKITSEKNIEIKAVLKAGAKFVKWIVPPTCKKANLKFTYSKLFPICRLQYLYVKTNSSDTNGQIFCAEDVKAGVTITSDTEIFIFMINYGDYSSERTFWEADVTFDNIIGCSATDPPTPNVACEKWPTRIITSEDTVGNIGCGWNVKAPEKGSLTITCDKIELNGNDTIFGGQNEPSLTLRKVSFKLNLHSGYE